MKIEWPTVVLGIFIIVVILWLTSMLYYRMIEKGKNMIISQVINGWTQERKEQLKGMLQKVINEKKYDVQQFIDNLTEQPYAHIARLIKSI